MIAYLDESVPVRLSRALGTEGCQTSRFPNDWKGLKNGELLSRLRVFGVSCLITCDKNFEYQQSIAASGIALVVLPRQRFGDLEPLVTVVAEAIAGATAGEVVLVDANGQISKR